ncbi:hypothetical protein M3Y97_00029900 [Aphelenchoides bicaudatus]|nr:hypothetical protein M3Y97_00029900 [Aphelenchoides bicaudatus]
MSAYEASELLQKRNQLRDEHKKQRAQHENFQAIQAETNRDLTKLATEKTEHYRRFCSNLSQHARVFDAEKEYRNFECALFGKSGGADALRAVQLGGQVSDAFRALINKIRDNVQYRIDEISKQRLENQLKKLKNDNDTHRQKLQQDHQRNNVELNKSKMKLNEAMNQLNQAEKDYESACKQIEEVIKQNSVISARTDAQASTMRQVEAKLANIDGEELDLLNQFAEYMVGATTRFESLSKMNSDLAKQKDMLLDVTEKIVDQTKLLIHSLPVATDFSMNNAKVCLDDLMI